MEQTGNNTQQMQEQKMIKEVLAVIARAEKTIWQDFVGGTALGIALIGALHLPGLS